MLYELRCLALSGAGGDCIGRCFGIGSKSPDYKDRRYSVQLVDRFWIAAIGCRLGSGLMIQGTKVPRTAPVSSRSGGGTWL